MTSSPSSSSRGNALPGFCLFLFCLLLFCLPGAAAFGEPGTGGKVELTRAGRAHRVAVFPLDNLSSSPAPLPEIRQLLVNRLTGLGLQVLDETDLQEFLSEHRLRYTGGITWEKAQALKGESGADAVLLTSLELYNEAPAPKISLTSRLVSTGDNASILWMKSAGLAGNETPGFLSLNLIEDHGELLQKALDRIFLSLSNHLAGRPDRADEPRGKKVFKPKIAYTSPVLDPDAKHRVAILPFLNLSERRRAGEIMTLHFTRHLHSLGNFQVIEPGMARQALLKYRIIMYDGLSLPDARALFKVLDADLILSGRVMDYQDFQGPRGTPKVDFSALLLERKSQQVVWSSRSYNTGEDGVRVFNWGRISTAHAMGSLMVRSALEGMFEGRGPRGKK